MLQCRLFCLQMPFARPFTEGKVSFATVCMLYRTLCLDGGAGLLL